MKIIVAIQKKLKNKAKVHLILKIIVNNLLMVEKHYKV